MSSLNMGLLLLDPNDPDDVQMELSSDEERRMLTELAPSITSTHYSSTSSPTFARSIQTSTTPQTRIPIEIGDERRGRRLQHAQKHLRTYQLPKMNKDLRYHSAQKPKLSKASHVRLKRLQNVRQVMGIGSTGLRLRWLLPKSKASNLQPSNSPFLCITASRKSHQTFQG